MAHQFSEANFQAEVLDSKLPVLVDFWAPWCGPCQMMGPVVEELASELEGKVKIGKVNVDENPSLAQTYGIMSIPCFILFKNGSVAAQQMGAVPKQSLLDFINR